MKLFKSLLVAPATLGLLAPMAATANEVTINDFNPAEELAITNSRVDGLEAKLNNIEAGSFSETTTASFSTNMYLGYEDTAAGAGDDAVSAAYDIQIDLNTSFTGEDSLDISLDGGNAGATAIDEFDGNNTTVGNTGVDGVAVDGVTYTFPIGDKTTAFVGFDTDGSQLYTTACVYGGPGNMLDDCGNVNAAFISNEAAVGASYDFGNGLTAAFGAQTNTGNVGVFTEESRDFFGLNTAYTGYNYGVSVSYADLEFVQTGVLDSTFWAFNGYYTPEGLPSISVGYETAESAIASINATSDTDSSHWFVGLTWDEVGPGSAGFAVGTKNHTIDADGYEEELMYEAYYEYPVNDGMTITPLVFVKEVAAAGKDDTTGVMVKTSFSF